MTKVFLFSRLKRIAVLSVLFLFTTVYVYSFGNKEKTDTDIEIETQLLNGYGEMPWEVSPFKASASEIQSASKSISLEECEQVKVLLREDIYTIFRDGTVENQRRWVYQIIDKKGVENWASTSGRWSPWYQHRPLIKVRVTNPDGEQYFLDKSSLVESAANSYSDKIYSDSKVLSGPLPHIMVGSIIEEHITIKDKKPFFSKGSVQRIHWNRAFPVSRRRVIVRVENDANLNISQINLDDIIAKKRSADGFDSWVFQADNLEKAKDLEQNLPPNMDLIPHIVFTTGSSWGEVASAYLKDVNSAINGVSLLNIVKPLISDTEDKTILNIVKHLNEKVRYTGMELGENALIPFSPMETLNRGWGDCKDKSVLLSQMLQDAGISAYPALVRTNSRRDINPNMAGMGDFNHCIVFVDGQKQLWIDPTSDYLLPGTIGVYEQDRYSLIIREGSDSLVHTSRESSSENLIEEFFYYNFTEKGYSDLIIKKRYHGSLGASLRGYYSYKSQEELEKNFLKVINKAFRFGDLDKLEFSDTKDLETPFEITATISKMGRASTDFVSASAAIMQNEMVDILPSYFLKEFKDDEERENPFYFNQPSKIERTYRINPPTGFVLDKVPKSDTIVIGPFSVKKDVKTEGNKLVIKMEFDIESDRLEVSDVISLKKNAYGYFSNMDAISLNYYHEGKKLLSEGDYKGSLAKFREYAELENASAIHHIRLAKAYLTARLVPLAEQEINKAIELDNENKLAWSLKGEIYKRNDIGRILQPGFKLEKSIAAFRKAVELDPDNTNYKFNLSEMLSCNSKGVKYADDANISEAVDILQELVNIDSKNRKKYENTLLFAAYFANEFEIANEVADKLSNDELKKFFIGLLTYFQDGEEAMYEYLNDKYSQSEIKSSYQQIAHFLINKREYKIGAQMMRKAAVGSEDAMDLEYEADLISGVNFVDSATFNRNSPEGLVNSFLFTLFSGNGLDYNLMKPMMSEALFNQMVDSENGAGFESFYDIFIRGNISIDKRFNSFMDRFFSRISIHIKEKNGNVFNVKVDLRDAGYRGSLQFFLLKDNDALQIIGFDSNINGLGEALSSIFKKNGENGSIQQFLNWLNDLYKIDSEIVGEPLDGFSFIKILNENKNLKNSEMKKVLALLSVETGGYNDTILDVINYSKSSDEKLSFYCSSALLSSYTEKMDAQKILHYSKILYNQEKQSIVATQQYLSGLLVNNLEEKALKLIKIKEEEGFDKDKLSTLYSYYYSYTNNYEAMRKYVENLEEKGEADAGHYNNLAWYSLFNENGPQDKDFLFARKAVKMSGSKTSAYIHTLACLYAYAGRCNEAVTLLDKLEELSPTGRYTSSDWYLYGLIAEQYGATEYAKSAYGKVAKDKFLSEIPSSCSTLIEKSNTLNLEK